MNKLVILLPFILVACGDSEMPEPYVLETTPDSYIHIITTDDCEYVSWKLNDESFPGVIDTSYDLDVDREGIQVKVGIQFIHGVIPEEVRLVVLHNGKFLPTTFVNGVYESRTTIHKDEYHTPQTVMFQMYTYGWCNIPALMSTVSW